MKYRICDIADIPQGEKRAYIIKNVPLLVVHSRQGAFYAIYNRCPHQHVPLSEGVLCGITVAGQPGDDFIYTRDAEIIRCPWHGFSFDVTNGQCLAASERLRVKTFSLSIDQHNLFVEI